MTEGTTLTVLVVSESKSYLTTSILEHLHNKDFEAEWSGTDVNSLHTAMDKANAVLINVSEAVVNDARALIYIRDVSIEKGTPVFLFGDANELERATRTFGSNVIKESFVRPIDVNEMVDGIRVIMDDYHGNEQKKILVVDDSGAMLRNVKGWFENRYQVILANSGAMAIKYLATDKPDLVLLDYEMPIIDGKQVLEMIRSEIDFQDIPVIFLTSKDDRDSIIKVMSLRPEGYLLKTLPPAQIIAEVDKFFEKQKTL